MAFTLNKTQLDASNRPYRVFFQDQQTAPGCVVYSQNATSHDNATLVIQSNFNECGIQSTESNNSIVYNQTIIILFEANNSTLQDELELQHVQCIMDNNASVPLNSGSINVTVKENEIIKCKCFCFVLKELLHNVSLEATRFLASSLFGLVYII